MNQQVEQTDLKRTMKSRHLFTIILDGAEIGEGAFIGAGSLVSQGKKIPPNTLAFGRPAKVVRELTEEDRKDMERIRTQYVEKSQYYKSLQK